MIETQRTTLLIDERLDANLCAALAESGGKVITCESPKEAWHLIYPTRPDVIVLHLYHPGPDDLALLQECRVMAKGTPILVASSARGDKPLIEILGDQASAFITLPEQAQDLHRILEALGEFGNED